ncbi:ABC transporter permease [Schlesneria paludicola]|uniref:ABC transporter permease n=1 Tax=Schlesneria paludicola TaxID=360056 RepID=UPI000299EECA|nr:ABC transporter permease [Schlesneria paludicola]
MTNSLETRGLTRSMWRFALRLGRPFLALFTVALLFYVADYWKHGQAAAFGQEENLRNIATQTAIVAVAALGMTVVIISGGIDLSVGTAIALAATMLAWSLKEDIALRLVVGENVAHAAQRLKAAESDRNAAKDAEALGTAEKRVAELTVRFESVELASKRWTKWTPWLALVVGVGTGCFCGLLNGFLISYLKMVPFIVTLGTMQFYLGLAKWVADNTTVRPDRSTQVPAWYMDLLSVRPSAQWLGVPAGVWVTIVLSIILAAVLHYTVFGRYVFAIGSNEATARLCGINVPRNKIAIYTLSGLFVGIAGLYQFSRMTVGNPTSGVGLELRVIASVVIGGGSLNGGRATVLGALSGALIMSVVASGCTQLEVSNPVQDMLLGIVIVIAVAVDQWRHGKSSA